MSLVGSSILASISAQENILTASGNTDTHAVSSATTSPAILGLTDGTGVDKAQKSIRQVLTLSTTPTDVDLTACVGGINNVAVNFTKIKEFWLRNLDAAISVTVGGTAGTPTNAWTNFINGTALVNWNELFLRIDHKTGWVVGGANKLLRLVAISGTPQVELILVGEGA